MERIVAMALILLIVILIIVWRYKTIEKLEPERSTGLIDPMQLAATVFRTSNTILTAADVFSDKMDSLPLPENIKDEYNEWIEKGFISTVKDQMLCGGCWAFATCGTLADRLTIVTNGGWAPKFGLSEQVLISCGDEFNMQFYQGCEGGIPQYAITALASEGVPADISCPSCAKVEESTEPTEGGGSKRSGGVVNPNDAGTCASGGSVYASTDYSYFQTGCDGNTSCNLVNASTCPCESAKSQMRQLDPHNAATLYKTVGDAHSYTSHGENDQLHTVDLWPDIPDKVIKENVLRMKKAIYYEGPLTIGYRVTKDFYTYWPTATSDNYYRYDGRSAMAGGHAVSIVGWKKTSDGTPVWICKNSWGVNGGYGFDKPTIVDEATGEEIPKYRGGFWNHIMGENDSFVESNAIGAHPDIHNPEISRFLPNNAKDIPKEWFETMTIREIYESAKGVTPTDPVTPIFPPKPQPKPEPKPEPKPQPKPEPKPQPKPTISSDIFNITTMTSVNTSTQSIRQFFLQPNSRYMLGASSTSDLQSIIDILPVKDTLTQNAMYDLAAQISALNTGFIVLGTKGNYNNYYYLVGMPSDWDSKNVDTYSYKAATITKFSNDLEYQLDLLSLSAPIAQISTK